MDILRFKPRGYFILDNISGAATDVSGYGITSTISATDRGVSLSSNAAISIYGNAPGGGTGLSFAKELWLRGNERESSSVAVTIFPVNPNDAIKVPILVPASNDEGIWTQGTTLYFGTRYQSAGIAVCEYEFEFTQRMVILAVHTPAKNSLYVNGELVSEVDITPEQQIDVFKNTTAGASYSGGTSNIATALFNEVAFFESALSPIAAKTIYQEQSRGMTGNIPSTFGGEKITLSTAFRVPQLAFAWTDAKHWDKALQINCIVDEDILLPETREGLSLDAQWLTSVNMYKGATPLTVSEINVDYSGRGITVSISLDGINWTLANGSVAMSFDPHGQDLYVKVDFAPGLEDSFLDNLYINAYTSGAATTQSGRTVIYNQPTSVLREYTPQILHEKWGVRVDEDGTVNISDDNNTLSVEFWIRPGADADIAEWNPSPRLGGGHGGGHGGGGTIIGTYYVNGVEVEDYLLLAGIWYHVIVTDLNPTEEFNLYGFATYGMFAIYDQNLDSSQVQNIYSLYSRPITATASDSSALTMTESATPALIYATDYAVVSAN